MTEADERNQFYIAIVGGGECGSDTAALAEETGELVAREGWVLLNGGLGGVMEAASKGARRAGGVVIGLLPGLDRSEGNPHLSFALATGLGHVRNALLVTMSDAVIAIDGGFGTLSEIAFARVRGKPVISLAAGVISLAAGVIGLAVETLPGGPGLDPGLFQAAARTAAEAVAAVRKFLLEK